MRLLLIVLALFLTPLFCLAQTTPQPQSLDNFFAALENDGNINGNVLVVESGKVLYQKSFGYADFESKKPNSEKTVFQFDSISKTMTAVAVLQLKEQGKLSLDDKFIKYFPEFPYPTVSIRQMLSHTSGLPDFDVFEETVTKNPDRIITNEDIIPEMIQRKRPLLFQPGERWSYANANFNLLALLIEKITHSKFEDYLKKNIFARAKMETAFLKTPLINATHKPEEAYYYDYPYPYSLNRVRITDTFSLPRFKIEYYNLYGLSGGGSVKGTTDDLNKFDQALDDGTLLKAATLAEAFTPVKLNNGENAVADFGGVLKTAFGLGWFILDDTSAGKIVGHTGGRYGSQTMFLRNLDKKQTVIFFDNAESEGVYRHALTALNILNNKPPLIQPKSLVRIYGRALVNNGIDFAVARLLELKPDTVHYRLRENEMNDLGYYLLANNYNLQALETFKIITLLFPESWNAYDSYGEALLKSGKKEGAIMMYKKSIELNPKNDGGRQALKKLQNEPEKP
jgi:CubicO group peptidase (beta-lactamase class C family)